MEQNKNIESGFQVNNMILAESVFSRINNVQFSPDASNDLQINTEVSVNGNSIVVAEVVDLVQKYKDIEQFKFHVRMIGIFESVGESEIKDLNHFGCVNGAAIIFPYIREHISNLSLKAGLTPILLAPMNFTNQSIKGK